MDFLDDLNSILEDATNTIGEVIDEAQAEEVNDDQDVRVDFDDIALDQMVGNTGSTFISDNDIEAIDAGRELETDIVDADATNGIEDKEIGELEKDIEDKSVVSKDDIQDIKDGEGVLDYVNKEIAAPTNEEFEYSIDEGSKFSFSLNECEVCNCSPCICSVANRVSDADEDIDDDDDEEEIDDPDDPRTSYTLQSVHDTNGDDSIGGDTPNLDATDELNGIFDEDDDLDEELDEYVPVQQEPLNDNLNGIRKGEEEMFDEDFDLFLEDVEAEITVSSRMKNLDKVDPFNKFEGSSINAGQVKQDFLTGWDINSDEDGFAENEHSYTIPNQNKADAFFNLADDAADDMALK